MKCHDDETWLRLALGELTRNESDALENHSQTCSVCRERLRAQRALLVDLSAPAWPPTTSAEEFVAGVIDQCKATPGTSGESAPTSGEAAAQASKRAWNWRSVTWTSAAALGLAAAFLLVHRAVSEHEPAGTWQARGVASGRSKLKLEVFALGEPRHIPLENARLGPGQGVVLRYQNAGTTTAYLMLFAVDNAREVHWVYPAYLNAGEDPKSVEIPPTRELQTLGEVVEPEGVAPGPLKFYAVVTATPLGVQDVEARLRAGADVVALFPEAIIQEWSSTWSQP